MDGITDDIHENLVEFSGETFNYPIGLVIFFDDNIGLQTVVTLKNLLYYFLLYYHVVSRKNPKHNGLPEIMPTLIKKFAQKLKHVFLMSKLLIAA